MARTKKKRRSCVVQVLHSHFLCRLCEHRMKSFTSSTHRICKTLRRMARVAGWPSALHCAPTHCGRKKNKRRVPTAEPPQLT
eukprot:COSAG06_NODE_9478_length_1890_cov_1.513121_2_plen_82_part_00